MVASGFGLSANHNAQYDYGPLYPYGSVPTLRMRDTTMNSISLYY